MQEKDRLACLFFRHCLLFGIQEDAPDRVRQPQTSVATSGGGSGVICTLTNRRCR
jgi:hypothetical protein